jgi:hypothetical protein
MFSVEQDFSHGYPDIGLVSVGVGWCWRIALLSVLERLKVKQYNTALVWVAPEFLSLATQAINLF